MGSKRKIFQSKPALLGNEAAVLLADLIDSDLSTSELLQVGVHNGLRVFVETDGLSLAGFTATDTKTGNAITPTGLQEIVEGLERHVHVGDLGGYNPALEFGDDGYVFSGASTDSGNVEWVVSGEPAPNIRSTVRTAVFRFKPADIQALANKLDGKPPVAIQQEELLALRERVHVLDAENKALIEHGAVAGGVTFPYSTPELEAMRDAITRHWEPYADGLRKPSQHEIGMTISEALGLELDKEGRPRRAAKVLATAIKPGEHRDT